MDSLWENCVDLYMKSNGVNFIVVIVSSFSMREGRSGFIIFMVLAN